MCILYAYKLSLKVSSKCTHPNYYFIVLNVSTEFVLIYRPHPVQCLLSEQDPNTGKNLERDGSNKIVSKQVPSEVDLPDPDLLFYAPERPFMHITVCC